MSLYEHALRVALEAHQGQTDKSGRPYIKHPIAVAMAFENETLQAIALLHDVLEDTDCTVERMKAYLIPDAVIDCVKILTRHKDESYDDYLTRVKEHPGARAVKIVDLQHNLRRDQTADPKVRKWLERRRARYYRALAMLDAEET